MTAPTLTPTAPPPMTDLPPVGASPFPVQDQPTGPTLDDAQLGPVAAPLAQAEPAAPPMTNEQIIGLVANLSSFGLPPELAAQYADDFQSNPLVQIGVQFAGLADALAEYGLTSGSGKLPAWLSVTLGVAVLGYGVYTTRGKYAPQADPQVSAPGAAGPFGFAGAGVPLQTTDFSDGGAADAGGGARAAF